MPLVLLLHLGAFDARVIDRLLDQYLGMGNRFVTLDQAETDPFYVGATDLRRAVPTPTLDSATLGIVAVPQSTAMLPGSDVGA